MLANNIGSSIFKVDHLNRCKTQCNMTNWEKWGKQLHPYVPTRQVYLPNPNPNLNP